MAQNSYNRRKTANRTADREIPGWILTIASAFLFLCAVAPIVLGPISGAVYGFLLGAFGFAAYPILLTLLITGIYFIQNRKLAVPRLYAVCAGLIGLTLIFIMHLATTYTMLGKLSFAEYTSEVFNGPSTGGVFTAGGVVFGTIVYGIQTVLTPVWSFVVFGLALCAIVFVILNRRFGFTKAKKYARGQAGGFQKTDRSAALVRKVADRDLFVETIRPQTVTQSHTEIETAGGSFSELAQSKTSAEVNAASYSVAPAKEVDSAEVKKVTARDILFGDRESKQLSPFSVYPFTQLSSTVSVPQQAVSAPDIKDAHAQPQAGESVEKPPIIVHDDGYKSPLQLVPIIPEKNLSYVPGEILNGEAVSAKLAEQQALLSSQSAQVAASPFSTAQPRVEQRPQEVPHSTTGSYQEPVRAAAVSQARPAVQPEVHEINPRDYLSIYAESGFITHKIDLPKIPERQGVPTPKEASDVKPLSGDRYQSFESETDETADKPIVHAAGASAELPVESTPVSAISASAIESPVQQEMAAPEIAPVVRNDHSGYYTPIEDVPVVPSTEPRARRSMRALSPENQVRMEKYLAASAAQTPEEAPAPKPRRRQGRYNPPPIELLVPSKNAAPDEAEADVQERARMLENTLDGLKLPAKVAAITRGPSVTRYELEMPHGIPIKRIEQYVTDIEYYLASNGKIRLETPIPGKRAVGIEVPNAQIDVVGLRDVIQSNEFAKASSPLSLAVGKDIAGANIICELNKMPHLLIAGATGSGKSACLNSIIMSLVYKSSPEDVRLILIDPKHVEFTMYKNLPHLLTGDIINDGQQALNAFRLLKNEMDRRYLLFAKNYVRDLPEFNKCAAVKNGEEEKLPYIVLIVDELAELMMSQNRKDLEEKIMSMAQKARASGIHLILATQRPTVDVITGTIKANLPSRIAFSVKSVIDSRTILDSAGAETLLGRGDMLYAPIGVDDPRRVQGAFVTNEEVASVIEYVKMNNEGIFDEEFMAAISAREEAPQSTQSTTGSDDEDNGYDPLMSSVLKLVIETGTVSTSFIQRRFAVGYSRAARIVDQMEQSGFIGPLDGGKPRAVFITREKFIEVFGPEKYAEIFGEELYES